MTVRSITVLLLAGLTAAGCLRKDTTHTLYLTPDGTLRWTIDESGVHSDEEDPTARDAEDFRFISAASLASHPAAMALQAIGPDLPVRTTILRDTRPFHVVTDASFTRIDSALERMFRESGIPAKGTLTTDTERTRVRLDLDFSRATENEDRPTTMLLDDLGAFRFVLTEGRFVPGGGFDVHDRTRATITPEWLAHAEEAMRTRRPTHLTLTWTPN